MLRRVEQFALQYTGRTSQRPCPTSIDAAEAHTCNRNLCVYYFGAMPLF